MNFFRAGEKHKEILSLKVEFLWFGVGVEFRDRHWRTSAELVFTKVEIARCAK